MKKTRCASGGMVKQPMTMTEQLQAMRGKVRPGYAEGGSIYPQDRVRKPDDPQDLSFVGHLQKIGGLVARAIGEATGSQPAPTSNPVDPVEMIKRRNMDNAKARDYAAGGMVKKGMAAGGVAGIDTPLSLQDESGIRAALPTTGVGAIQNGGIAVPLQAGALPQSLGMIGAPKYESAGDYVPQWSDGSRRDNLTPEQAQQLKSEKAMADARAAPVQAIAAAAPLQTMAEKQIAAGFNPNAAYRPGGIGDPHASTGLAATVAQRLSATEAQPQAVPPVPVNPFDTRSRRQLPRTPGLANGGVVDPVEELLKRTSKNYGLGQPAPQNPQPVPQPQPQQQQPQQAIAAPQQTPPGMVDALRHRRQDLDRVMRYADGGMVRFAGKGGPREDKIPVKVAGSEIRVSDGEQAVILPAKTAANPQAVQAIGQIIQQSNDGRAPKMGMADGGRYEFGSLPAQPIYRPNWTPGNNAPVLEGVVETADELRAKAAQPAARAIAPPQPGTAVTPRAVDWTPGGGAPAAGGPMQARTVDWTYGQGGGPMQQPGMARAASPTTDPLSITGPQEAIKADPRTMARTAAAARASGGMSPEAAAFDASRTAVQEPSATAAKPTSKLSGMAGKAAKILAPVAKFATVADIAANAYNSGRDGGAIQLAPSEQQTDDYVNQGGMARFASAAKHGMLAGALNAGDAAAGVIDGAAGLPNLILPKNAQIPSVQQIYRQKAQDVFAASGDNGTVTIRADQQKPSPQQAQATYSNEGRQSAVQSANTDAQTADPRIAATTGNSGARVMPSGAVEVNMGRGFDPTKLAMAPGSGMVSDATGRTMVVTNMDPNQYTAADGTKNARWEQTQAYIDAQNRLQADKLRLAEMQAVRQGTNPVQAIAATQGMAQAAQRAPLDRAVVQQQIETGKMAAQNAQRLQAAADAVTNAKTPEERAAAIQTYHAINGKSDGKPVVVDLGDEVSADGMTKIGKGQVALDPVTYQPIPLGAAAPSKKFNRAEVDAAIKAGASREAVAARIKSMGMNPKDYGL